MIRWLVRLYYKIFPHTPTKEEIRKRRKETAEKLGFVFYSEKEREKFIEEIRNYDFLKNIK